MTLPTIIVEVGFTTGSSTGTLLILDDTSRGKLDTGTLGSGSEFTDVTDHVQNWSCSRGSSRGSGPLLRYEAGKARIVFRDEDRRFDPTNLSGPYVSGGVTQVVPNVLVRLRALLGSTYYDIWRGFADGWVGEYLPGNRATLVTLTATDGFKILGRNTLATAGSAGAGDDSGARITRILNAANWPLADRVISTGDSTLQATTLGANALSLCQLVADSEMGEFYMDAQGRAFFRNRQAIAEDTRSNTSQVTWGDAGGAELPYYSTVPSYDDDQLVNQAKITRVGGAEQTSTVSASASITANQLATFERSDVLMETDGVALDMANMLVYVGKDPEQRMETISIGRNQNSATEDLIFAQALGRLIGDRMTVKRQPAGGGTVSNEVFLRGIQHSSDRRMWNTTFVLQSAAKYSFFTLDDATLGKLDSNALAY